MNSDPAGGGTGSQASPRVELHGEYDLRRLPEVKARFDEVGDSGEIVIDVGDVTYVDSSILNEFVRLRNRLPASRIQLRNVGPQLRRLLDIVDFASIFDISGDP